MKKKKCTKKCYRIEITSCLIVCSSKCSFENNARGSFSSILWLMHVQSHWLYTEQIECGNEFSGGGETRLRFFTTLGKCFVNRRIITASFLVLQMRVCMCSLYNNPKMGILIFVLLSVLCLFLSFFLLLRAFFVAPQISQLNAELDFKPKHWLPIWKWAWKLLYHSTQSRYIFPWHSKSKIESKQNKLYAVIVVL